MAVVWPEAAHRADLGQIPGRGARWGLVERAAGAARKCQSRSTPAARAHCRGAERHYRIMFCACGEQPSVRQGPESGYDPGLAEVAYVSKVESPPKLKPGTRRVATMER